MKPRSKRLRKQKSDQTQVAVTFLLAMRLPFLILPTRAFMASKQHLFVVGDFISPFLPLDLMM